MYQALSEVLHIYRFIYSSRQPYGVGSIISELKEQAEELANDGASERTICHPQPPGIPAVLTERFLGIRHRVSTLLAYVTAGDPQRNSELATITSILQMWELGGSSVCGSRTA